MCLHVCVCLFKYSEFRWFLLFLPWILVNHNGSFRESAGTENIEGGAGEAVAKALCKLCTEQSGREWIKSKKCKDFVI